MRHSMSKRAPLTFDVEKIAHAPAAMKTRLLANTQTEKQENTETPKPAIAEAKGRAGRQFIAAHVLPEAAKQFKLLTVQQERTTQSMLIEAINDLFVKYGLSRIADE
jgi:hypothetical protein